MATIRRPIARRPIFALPTSRPFSARPPLDTQHVLRVAAATTCLALLFLLHAPTPRASEMFAGTMHGLSWSEGRVLRYAGGTTWTDITGDLNPLRVWDLEWHDDALWASGQDVMDDAFIGRWDGSDWQIWSGPGSGFTGPAATALAVVQGKLYAGVRGQGIFRLDGNDWNWVGSANPIARMQGDDCGVGEPLLFVGGDFTDDFWVHDPSGALSCGAPCPSAGAGICPAGCHGGSCIHSMTLHDDGAGAIAHAGAYRGEMYQWNGVDRNFQRVTRIPTSANVQALASFRGRLTAGLSDGVLASRDSAGTWQTDRIFGIDEPLSALAVDPETNMLWIGHGGVPFAFARDYGKSMIRTWDGTAFVDRGSLEGFDGGVPALLVVPGGSAACDAGPPQVVECSGVMTPVTLHGTSSGAAPCTGSGGALLTWTGGFIEAVATGASPTVHFAGPGDYPITLSVASGAVVDECGTLVTVRDLVPPSLTVAPDLDLDCEDPVPAPAATALDACDPAPTVALEETIVAGPCPQARTLIRTWTATDASGNVASVERRIEVRDVEAPVLSGLPSDLSVPCPDIPAPPAVGAVDACDPDIAVLMSEERIDGPCPGTYDLVRTWSALDDCGNLADESRIVHVSDLLAPTISGVPADALVACDAVPLPASPSALDECDSSPLLVFEETRIDGPCGGTYQLTRTWTATDHCGNALALTQAVNIVDDMPPQLSGVPADVAVECPAVPAPAAVTATDGCDGAPALVFGEIRIDGSCPGNYELIRTWTATDDCGNAVSASQVVTVSDTTPPSVEASAPNQHVLWPPNHRMVTFDQDDFAVAVDDACSGPVTWLFANCVSDQPDDGLGDGHTSGDCVVAPDGTSFSVRAERQGGVPAGRTYSVGAVATDACGNESAITVVGSVHVPHDRR